MVPRLLLAAGLLLVCLADDIKSSAQEANPSALDDNPSEMDGNPSEMDDNPSEMDDNPSVTDDNPYALLSPASLIAIELSKDALPAEFTCTSRLLCNRPVYYISSFFLWLLISIGEVLLFFADPIMIFSAVSRNYRVWRRRNPDARIVWSRLFYYIFVFVNQSLLAYLILSKFSDWHVNSADSVLYVPSFLLRWSHSVVEFVDLLMVNKSVRITFIDLFGNLLSLLYELLGYLVDKYKKWREGREMRTDGDQEEPIVEQEHEEYDALGWEELSEGEDEEDSEDDW